MRKLRRMASEHDAGALLLLGLFTRIAAFSLSGEMAFAYFIGHAPKGFYPLTNGGESAVLPLASEVVLHQTALEQHDPAVGLLDPHARDAPVLHRL